MIKYNTNNPIGSPSVKDIHDNSINFDNAVNDRSSEVWIDRFGQNRKSWYGIEKESEKALTEFRQESKAAILAAGYVPIDSFQDGATLTIQNQVLRWKQPDGDGGYYRWDGPFPKNVPANSSPASSGGVGDGKWKLVGDATFGSQVITLQNELANAQKTIATQQRTITTNNNVLNNSQLELIAHRGFARQFPQNSLFGFSCAIEAGATSLECDVQASTDGVLYVFHDLDVSALTNGTGLFREKNSAEIDQLRYKNVQGTPYADIRIPRFQDVLFLCKERGVKIYAEFSDHMTDANILEYIRLITYYDAESNVSTQCFNNDKLLFVRQHNKNLELGFLRPTAADYEAMLPILQANAPAMFLMEMNSFLSDSTIAKKCRSANVGLAVWTVQNGTDLARVMRAGCNRVVSDVSLITKRRG
ncbi:Glycerophosphoryl diester phosphodiesterase [Acinetobacter baumannii]|nr:Glycerophosphoryl diester phosphodiesterase [Acinetobacter baumannii]